MRRGDDKITLGSLESGAITSTCATSGAAVAAAMQTVRTGHCAATWGVARRSTPAIWSKVGDHRRVHGAIVESDDGSSRSSPVPWQRADIAATTRLRWAPQSHHRRIHCETLVRRPRRSTA